jgi:hypothetical protein
MTTHLALDDGHCLALGIAVGNWRDVTCHLRVVFGAALTDDPEAAELSDLLGSLESRLIALRDDYYRAAGRSR